MKIAKKVPMVMQLEALECGAASLSMILAYYGKWIPLEQLREDCGVSRDGSKAKNILKAARSYGLMAKGYRYEIEQLKEVGKFPYIIHWEFNHFVVLNGFKGDKAIINDPARGVVKLSMEEFDKAFTGICLAFETTENFEAGGKPESIFNFAKKRLKGTGIAFIFVILTTIISAIVGIIMPGFSRILIDRLLTGQNLEWFKFFITGLILISTIQITMQLIKALYMLKIQGKFAIVANSEFMWHLLRMPMRFFSQRMAGDIAMRQNLNETIAESLITKLAPLVMNLAMLIFYLLVMLRYSTLLTIIGVSSIFINIFLANVISKKRVNITRVQLRDEGKLVSATVSGIEMIETIKASGAETGFFEKWSGYQASVNTQIVKFAKLNQYLGALPNLIYALSNIAVLIIGVILVIDGKFTVGMILAFQGFMYAFMEPAHEFISTGQSMQELRTNMELIEDIMNYPIDDMAAKNDISDDISYEKLLGNIELKNITFGYSPLDEPLVQKFNLSIKQGECIAIVGLSGCGKSTISKLISGLYKPWSGEVLFDGHSIELVNRGVLTSSLAVVDQEITLFEDTIANNIKMWDTSIEDFEMILAARDAKIHEDIMLREDGYQYKMLEGGKDFSGGQRQRIEIARVLAQDPTIIIMDEATSALDAKTENEVVKSIKARGITCIVVAHRLSTIRDCDQIIVMDNGSIIESGTHEELYNKDGMYKKLVSNE